MEKERQKGKKEKYVRINNQKKKKKAYSQNMEKVYPLKSGDQKPQKSFGSLKKNCF